MADQIPFITGQGACNIAAKIYSDSEFARITLDKAGMLVKQLPNSTKCWLDPAIDGLDDLATRIPTSEKSNKWYDFIKQIPGFEEIGNAEFCAKPDVKTVDKFVSTTLDLCLQFKPVWISIPQLPNVVNASRNKINRLLAKATGKWKTSSGYSGRLILPIIFSHQSQTNGKVERNPFVKHAGRCYHEAQADGYWVVDKSLEDASGSKTLRNTRFPAIVQLHVELNNEVPSKIRIAGPYWGMNLLLWARGLIDYPAIGVGSSYQYFLAGGRGSTPKVCLAITSLRRRVGLAGLGVWLDESLKKIGPNHPAASELTQMRKQLALLSSPERAREQVSKSYKIWIDLLASVPLAGRGLALFQDLSMAYAFGKSLPELNKDEGTARRPESVVEPLMLNSL